MSAGSGDPSGCLLSFGWWAFREISFKNEDTLQRSLQPNKAQGACRADSVSRFPFY